MLAGILWAVVVVLVILWLPDFVVLHVASFASHILLIVALRVQTSLRAFSTIHEKLLVRHA